MNALRVLVVGACAALSACSALGGSAVEPGTAAPASSAMVAATAATTSNYSLTLALDEHQLTLFRREAWRLALVRQTPVTGAAGATFVWLAFLPSYLRETVTWSQKADWVFASTSGLTPGTPVHMALTRRASDGATYSFFDNWKFKQKRGSGAGITVANKASGALRNSWSFGLAGSALIDRRAVLAPYSAAPIASGKEAAFMPESTVTVYFDDRVAVGTVLKTLPTHALTVVLTPQSPNATLVYSGGRLVLKP